MGIAASNSGSISATTIVQNSTSAINSTVVGASSVSPVLSSSFATFTTTAVVSSNSSAVDRNSSVSTLTSLSLSSIALSTSAFSSVSASLSTLESVTTQGTTISASLFRTEATVTAASANDTISSVQQSSQASTQSIPTTVSSPSVISKASMPSSSSASSTVATGSASGDGTVVSTSASSSTTNTVSSEASSTSTSSPPPSTISSSQASSDSSASPPAQTSTEAANGQSSSPSASAGQPKSTANGGQNSASTGTGGSTSVKVVTTVPSSTSTSTFIVTGHPESTLSSPIGITISSDGRLSTTFPALITFVSTSTNANGAETTWTSIVANPTNEVSGDVSDAHSFLHNEGAVAGVFTVVGIVFTAAVVALFVICRRRRQRKIRRHQWIDHIQKRLPAPEDPFENPRDAPMMRSMSQTSRHEHHYQFQSPSPTTARPFFDERTPWDHDDEGVIPPNSLGLTSMDATRISPFADAQYSRRIEQPIGLAVTTNSPPAHQSRPSLAQSSPSIYPPSIPLPNDNASIYEDIDLMGQDEPASAPTVTVPTPYVYPSEAVAGPPSPISPSDGPFDDLYGMKPLRPTPVVAHSGYPPPPIASPAPRASTAPLRPARSALRDTSSKIIVDQALVTPPPSLSGHGHEDMDSLDDSPSLKATSHTSSADEAVSPPVIFNSANEKQRPHSASKSIEDIVMRRTLLNVRPRSRDNVQNIGRI
ncbi:hypothetical protein F5878DRAFT_17950 [Lentinula raphanica]|uniref:Uncharacterized protein n=1 Tax=Lentinula raphanica TaxID=153919 RepID=A0AA38PF17_9AGAR|nr:hypothetical protein F5878DRAFT_17950 [Lentinula raphanica]